jgi:hypothetical protein
LVIQWKCWPQWAPFSIPFLLISLCPCLINRSADCANTLIEKMNISKLANIHPSILLAREIFIARTDFCIPYNEEWHLWCTWRIKIYQYIAEGGDES